MVRAQGLQSCDHIRFATAAQHLNPSASPGVRFQLCRAGVISQDEDTQFGNVEHQRELDVQVSAARGHHLRGIAIEPLGGPQGHQLRMPNGHDHLCAANRRGAGEDRVGVSARQTLVDQVFVSQAAAELHRILGTGVAI